MMKRYIKSLLSTLYLAGLLFCVNPVFAATTAEIETVFNWAEQNFPELFPGNRTTQMIDPWAFRFYPSTEVYVGVKSDEVFVFGGPWGTDAPTLIGALPDIITQIGGSGGGGTVPACSDTSEIPEGMVVSQNGNVVNVTTNGQCIKIPDPQNANFCEAPTPSQPTGISVLSTTVTSSFTTTGLTIDLPGVPNPLESFDRDSSFCVINAPAEGANLVVNSDICFDMTDTFGSLPSGVSGFTVTPPVTISTVTSTTSQQVSDCFATDALGIEDLFTGEHWTNVNGTFVPTGDLTAGSVP